MQRDAFAPGSFGAAIHAAVDTGELTEEEAPIVARSLLTAGVDTTVSGIGAAVYCLAHFPEQFARLRAEPSLARAAFEEAVRYESPVQTFFRTTTRPVEIGGIAVGEGEKVLMFLGAANRDPRQWERPDEYDIGRRAIGHVGFGSGIHQCVGQLRAHLLPHLAPEVRDVVIVGENRGYIAALGIPANDAVVKDSKARERMAAKLEALATGAAGSAQRVQRFALLTAKLSVDAGEITDKGVLNQRTIVRRHADPIDKLYSDNPSADIIVCKGRGLQGGSRRLSGSLIA